jgi:hypothetical protein
VVTGTAGEAAGVMADPLGERVKDEAVPDALSRPGFSPAHSSALPLPGREGGGQQEKPATIGQDGDGLKSNAAASAGRRRVGDRVVTLGIDHEPVPADAIFISRYEERSSIRRSPIATARGDAFDLAGMVA